MQPLTQDALSPQERFENAVKVLQRLVAEDDSDLPLDQGKAADLPRKPTDTASADGARTARQEAPESSLIDILSSFEFSLEEADEPDRSETLVSEKTRSNRPVIPGRKEGARPALPRGSTSERRASSANLDRAPDRKDLPSLKIVVGMITFAQIAAAVVLAFALASWLSIHPLDSFRDAKGKGSVEQPSQAGPAMDDAADSIRTGSPGGGFAAKSSAAILASNTGSGDMADVKGRFAQVDPEPPVTLPAGVEPRILRVSVQPAASHLAPALSAPDEPRPVPQNGVLVADPLPASSVGPYSLEGLASTPSANRTVEQETPSDKGSVGAERPDAASAQASPSRSIAVARVSAPERAEPPGAPAARVAAASLRDRAEAEIRKLSIQQDLRQALRSRAAREWRTKLDQDAVRDPSAPRSEPVSAADPREQHVLKHAELLLRNSDVNGARLVLERAAADGSGRAVHLLAQTYDPGILQDRWSIRDVRGDPVKAQDLYLRAQAAGVQDRATPPE